MNSITEPEDLNNRRTEKIDRLKDHISRNPHDFRAKQSLERTINKRAKLARKKGVMQ